LSWKVKEFEKAFDVFTDAAATARSRSRRYGRRG
jgi:hypothetical protein